MAVSQRLEMVRRIATEIEGYVVELGTDGRLLSLQLEELIVGRRGRARAGRARLPGRGHRPQAPVGRRRAARARHPVGHRPARPVGGRQGGRLPRSGVEGLEAAVSPRGYRLLAKVPRLPGLVVDRLVEHFGGLQKLLAAGIDDLQAVEGVGETRARSVREGLSRLAESSILERYV
jgi:diadenylate cyclase